MEQLLNDFSPGLFFMQAFILLVLILLMRKFAWKPILGALDDRENEIRNAIESAEKAKEEMAQLNASNEKLIQEAKVARDELLKEAQENAKSIITEAKDQAKVEGENIIKKAKSEIESEKKAALAELQSKSVALSVELAEKILRKELQDKKAQEELLADYLKEADLTV